MEATSQLLASSGVPCIFFLRPGVRLQLGARGASARRDGRGALPKPTCWAWMILTRLPPAAADPRRIKGKVTRTGPETRPQTQGPLIRSSTTTNKD